MEKLIERLQNEAKQFLTKSTLMLNNVIISPKEIEVYYYKKGTFEDESVHKNELQTKKHKNHFYVHRWGTLKTDSYKSANRAGLDFVISDDDNTYYSYLIRSAVIEKGEPIVGPNKVLKQIIEVCNFDNKKIEDELVKIIPNNTNGDVLFSNRINLNKGFINCKLRAVLCDDWFRSSKYPAKERMIIDFLSINDPKNMTKEDYAKNKLGYIPSIIR